MHRLGGRFYDGNGTFTGTSLIQEPDNIETWRGGGFRSGNILHHYRKATTTGNHFNDMEMYMEGEENALHPTWPMT
jgi:hypothetical protein